uniref:PIH1 domain-containing protein n=1 Tax=Caenorhabditis tropicalis TaxID=1561998 RepID=A0A1I7TS72_9PELO
MDLKIRKPESAGVWHIKPLPGYVCKWKDVKINGLLAEESRKCFVNICHCEELPPPIDDLDQEEVAAQLDSGKPKFRIPMTVGEIDCVKDKSNEDSIKIDVLVNSIFYKKRLSSPDDAFFRHLVSMIFCDLIKDKHGIDLDPWKPVILRNRISVGDLEVQRVNKTPESQIVEEMYQADKVRMEKLAKEQESRDDVIELKNEIFGIKLVEGTRLRLFDGKRLEISMRCEIQGRPVEDPSRLELLLNPTRCLVKLDKSRSLYDFGLPFNVDPKTAKSKFNKEKLSLVVSANIVL